MVDEEVAFETAALSEKANAIYTYSNVLLMGAEAIAKSEGVTAEEVDYLAQVRERAYWQEDPAAIRAELSNLSQEEFVEEVLEERVKELVFELLCGLTCCERGSFRCLLTMAAVK